MKKLIVILIAVTSISLHAQTTYPIEYLPGAIVNLKTGTDTLWVLDQPTMQQYMNYWETLGHSTAKNVLYVRELNTLKNAMTYKSKVIIAKNVETKEANEERDVAVGKLKKAKLLTKIGTGTGVLLGVLVGWLVL